jgi:diaminohydroxyphosphoribosylaminopyrimidine deaminase/5-amino-6-(5-phosphoribosylamino)uracil reductase
VKEGQRAATDQRFMRRAIELAERGLGETNPNPPVGCVLVRQGRVVGEGFHARAGSPHAEANALAMAGARARGATAYVTLEPCAPNPKKRTEACAPRLVAAGIRRVVFGVADLNPRVHGAGAARLKASGVEVVRGVCLDETRRLTQHFNEAMRRRRPFITLKTGMTLDGRIATAFGESQWITSKRQRSAARFLRRLFDGILVGVETVIEDDPLLLPVARTRRPYVRVVLDSRLRLPLASRLVETARRHPLLVICVRPNPARRRALEERGVRVIQVATALGRVSIQGALRALFAAGIHSLLVEGGSEVLGSFVRARSFDEMVIFRGPLILGGRGSRPAVGGDNPLRLGQGVKVRRVAPLNSLTLRYGLPDSSALEVEVYEPRPNRLVSGRRKV